MRILGIERDELACCQYRLLQPLYKLREHQLADTLTISDWQMNSDYAAEKIMEADIVVFQRPSSEEWFRFIKTCQKYGKLIVVDYDDDPFNTSPFNPFYKYVGTKPAYYKWPDGTVDEIWKDGENGFSIENNIVRQDTFRSCFKKADMITTTTDTLQGVFSKINPNTVILPNLIDFYYFQRPNMVKNEVRIGYQGGASHYQDIYIIRDILVEVLKRNPNSKFVYFGDFRFRNLFQEIPTSRIEHHSWIKFVAYPYKLQLLNLDIGLCPLEDNAFNRAKSCLKYLDYSAVGAATVATDIPPYSPVIKDGVDGFLAKDKKEWIEKLDRLVKDAELRKNMQQKAYENVYQNWNADKKAYLWKNAYEKLIKAEVTV